jgi:hypothetical protein
MKRAWKHSGVVKAAMRDDGMASPRYLIWKNTRGKGSRVWPFKGL